MCLHSQLHNEWLANQELSKIARKEGTARFDFNLTGDIAKQALRAHHAKKGSGIKRIKAVITTFFIGGLV